MTPSRTAALLATSVTFKAAIDHLIELADLQHPNREDALKLLKEDPIDFWDAMGEHFDCVRDLFEMTDVELQEGMAARYQALIDGGTDA
jgi:hydroxymethylpyrimidine/phosphomethylpyrimidine kinase